MGGKSGKGVDFDFMRKVVEIVKKLINSKVQVAVVIGGGNFWRYRDFKHSKLDRVHSDHLGMLATVINSISFQDELRAAGVNADTFCAFAIDSLVPKFNAENARRLLKQNHVVICAGGTGNPFCSTDMAAALRAGELKCDLMVKATNVNYAYDKDPNKYKDAKPLKKLSYADVLARGLGVLDLAAVATADEADVPIAIFNLTRPRDLLEILKGKSVGTIIK